MLTVDPSLARAIVERTMAIIPFSVNVMDERGVIIASGSPERVGSVHSGAQLALTRRATVEVDAPDMAGLQGAKPGINLLLTVRGEVCGVVGLTGQPDQVRQFGALVRLTAEMILEQAQLIGELQREKRYREEFVVQLVYGSGVSEESMAAWAARLGVDLGRPRAMVVAQVPAMDERCERVELVLAALQQVQSELALRWPDLLTAVISPGELAMLAPFDMAGAPAKRAAQARQRLAELHAVVREALPFPATLAMGIALPGLDGAAASYASARETARVGKLKKPDGEMFSYFDLSLPVLLSGLKSGWQAEQLRQPLARLRAADRKSGTLMATVTAWFAHHSHPGATAQALQIHRNTLDYRLQKIGDLTGLDLADTDDRFLLYVALQLSD